MVLLMVPWLPSPPSLSFGRPHSPPPSLLHTLTPSPVVLPTSPSISKTPSTLSNCSASKPSRSTSKSSKPTAPRSNNPLLKPLQLSPALQRIVGVSELSRAETIKRIWAYIKENHLQSETSKRVIVCDEKLKAVFGQDSLNFLEISRLLSPHFIKE